MVTGQIDTCIKSPKILFSVAEAYRPDPPSPTGANSFIHTRLPNTQYVKHKKEANASGRTWTCENLFISRKTEKSLGL